MENDTSLTPDSLRLVLRDYKKSLVFILKNKWLYVVPIFFILSDNFNQWNQFLSKKIFFQNIFFSEYIHGNVAQISQQSFSERLFHALTLTSPANIASSLSLLEILNLLGVTIAFFIFYRKFSGLLKINFIKKCSNYSSLIFLIGLVISFMSFFFLENTSIISFGIVIGIICLVILITILFTLIEGVFISYIKSLLKNEARSLELIFNDAGEFLKPLFLYNILFSFVSASFLMSILLVPDMVNNFLLHEVGNFSNSIPKIIYTGVVQILKYLNALIVVMFIFTPFIIASNPEKGFIEACKENLSLIRRDYRQYLRLILSGLLFIGILSLIFELLIPTSSAFSYQEILKETIYSAISTFFILVFSVSALRYVIGSKKN